MTKVINAISILLLLWALPCFCYTKGDSELLGESVIQRVKTSKSMRHIFEISDFVKLETTQDSLISGIKKVILLNGFWYVLDQDDVVFQFDNKGRFIRVVGGIGQGPGEYLLADDIQEIFDHRLAVYDSRAGALMIYNAEGEYIKKINLREWFKGRIPSFVLWDKPEQISLIGCHGLTRAHPIKENGIYRVINDTPTPIAFFNTNSNEVSLHFEKMQAKFAWTCAAVVGENLWIGSPYNAKIGVYNQKGELLKMLGRKYPDQILESEVLKLDINKQSDSSILIETARNLNIQPFGELVIAPIHSNRRFKTDIFSESGELLASALDSHPFNTLLGGGDGILIYELPPFDKPSVYKGILNEKEYALLTSKGFDPDAAAGQNSWLILAKPIQ